MLATGKLNNYLADIDKQARGITEQLKADNTLKWVGRLGNIQACAREIVEKAFFMCDCPFLCPFLFLYAASYRGILAIMFICPNLMAGESIGLPYLKKSL